MLPTTREQLGKGRKGNRFEHTTANGPGAMCVGTGWQKRKGREEEGARARREQGGQEGTESEEDEKGWNGGAREAARKRGEEERKGRSRGDEEGETGTHTQSKRK